MSQLSLYMDEPAMMDLRKDADAEGKSISSYAREVLLRRHDEPHGWVNGWPPGYFESILPLEIELPADLPPEPVAALD